jgi:hypothetical protein
MRIWDTKGRDVINDIDIDDFGEILFSGDQGTITLIVGGGYRVYGVSSGAWLCSGELLQSHNHQLGAHWAHVGSLRFAIGSETDGRFVVDIQELRPSSDPPLFMVESFPVLSQGGIFSFSPVSFHASFVSETKIVILGVRDSRILFQTRATQLFYTPPGQFSSDGRFFACGTSRGEICVWENASADYYLPWTSLKPQMPFRGFSFSPTASSILSWGPGGVQMWHQNDRVSPPLSNEINPYHQGGNHLVAPSAGRAHAATARQEGIVISRRAIIDPGQTCFYFRLAYAHHSTVELLVPEIYPRTQIAGYQRGDRRGCLQGTRETILKEIESWAGDSTRPPIFWLDGRAGTGKSAIAQTIVDRCDTHNKLASSVFCSRDANDRGNPRLIFPTLAIQLAQKNPKARSILVSLLRSNPNVVYESLPNQVEKLIVKLLESANVPAVIIIDALDEWTDSISQSAILSAVKYWIKEIPKVKFLMTSRAGFHLPLFSGLADAFTLHDATQDLVNNDIQLFLKHELSGLAVRNGLTNWPTDGLLDQLRKRADGLFVYAVATVKFLDHWSPIKQCHTILNDPDNTIYEGTVGGVHGGLSLDSLCTSIFRASFGNNDDEDDTVVRSVLATVVLVTHPLPPSAIADLICVEVREVMSILRSIQSLLKLHKDPSQPVYPFHKLLPDLVTSPTRCADERFYISPGKFHSEIALICLKLMNKTFEDNFPPQSHIMDYEVALKYACTSWYIHLTQAREDVTALIPTVCHFLENKIAAWLEVLGILADTAAAVSARDETISWFREVCFNLLKNPQRSSTSK